MAIPDYETPVKETVKRAKGGMRQEYKRSDFATLERGKFYGEVTKGMAVALLEPPIARAFPTSKAVNDALRTLLVLSKQTSQLTSSAIRRPRKRGRGSKSAE